MNYGQKGAADNPSGAGGSGVLPGRAAFSLIEFIDENGGGHGVRLRKAADQKP
jgi:hypothetical protein